MKNVFKVKTIRNITGIIAVVMAAIVFCFTACGGGGSTPLASPPSGPPVTPPEERSVKDRWGKWIADDATATLEYSVADNGVCKITVGGTAQPNNATDDWGRWKANAQYDYTAQAGKSYSYKFEAWTESGNRELSFQYNTDNVEEIYIYETVSITNTRTTYTVYGQPLSRNVINHVEFQCADQLGAFYVKILEIKQLILDSALNGTWVYNGDGYVEEYKFNNGNFETLENDIPDMKGTYTTDSGIIKVKTTHIYGGTYGNGLESKWYSEDDIKEILSYEDWEEHFGEKTIPYSVTGNTLKFGDGDEVFVFTRKQ